jgi:riboflavin biosynthesis pyrimidine reductase
MSYHCYADLTARELAELYAYPAGPVLRANMVASADGAASLDGASAGLSGAADRHVFALNRTLADVILVGAGTVRDEGYKPVRIRELWKHLREGRTPTPPIAVISGRLDLDPESPLFTSAPPHARTIVLTAAHADACTRAALEKHADVIVAGQARVDPSLALAALRDRGFPRILTEGGPSILAQFTAAGLLDELCLTVAPLLAGPAAPRIVTGAPFLADGAPAPVPLRLAHIIEADGFLLNRYQRS